MGDVVGQNLVPNGDFEYYTSCPTGVAEINLAFPWYDPNSASSDYYNTCAPLTTGVCVPMPYSGAIVFQYAHSGVAYAAIECALNIGLSEREYIQVPLTSPLFANQCYYVEFYTNKSNNDKYTVNNIGAYISSTAINCPMNFPMNLTPQILLPSNPVIYDSVNWTKIYGIYQATGGESYLTIGNFKYDSSTVFQIDSTQPYTQAYYYIDDVDLHRCSCDTLGSVGVTETNPVPELTLYPNPCASQLIIDNGKLIIKEIHIYNVLGCEILKQVQNDQSETIDVSKLPSGLYFAELVTEKGVMRRKFVKE